MLSQAIDRLYAAPLEQFIPLRKQVVSELKAAGDAAGAQQVAAAAKPTRTAWALNQIARKHPALLRELLRARDAAAKRSHGDADALRQGTRDYRERVNDVVRAARDLLAEGGVELNAVQARRMGETLQVACAEEGEARDRLMAGTLTQDVDVEDPFAGLVAGEGRPEGRPKAGAREERSASPGKPARDLEAERRQERERQAREQHEQAVQAARARIVELEGAEREARALARNAETAAAKATREADRAKNALEQAEERLEAARAELKQQGRPAAESLTDTRGNRPGTSR